MEDITLNLRLYYAKLLEIGKISGKYFNDKKMKHFPELYTTWKNSSDKNKFIYDIVHDITINPVCKICGNDTSIKNFRDGYRTYCSNTCVNIANSRSESFSKKISESKQKKFDESYYVNKYGFVTGKDSENFIVNNYCKHGEFFINKNKFKRLIDLSGEICEKCIDELPCEAVEVDTNIDKYANEIPYKHLHPLEWKTIIDNCKDSEASFSEKRYMLKHNIQKRPLCEICATRNKKFIGAYSGYTQTCTNITCTHSSSIPEQEIFNIIKNIYPDTISRHRIDKDEIDIFIPSKNIGIEFNGLYWHSEKFRTYRWHLDKLTKLRSIGIRMFTIWEDDWKNKRNIVVSQLLSLIEKTGKIYARATVAKEISKNEADLFIVENHLQGACNSLYRYGLFHNNVLVSVMTFGKNRMIFHDKTYVCEYELLRFCSKQNLTITGGASKLLSSFMKQIKPSSIVSYANYDFSEGNVYMKMGFSKVDKIYPGYWWCKDGQKFHRSNFMKHKIAHTEEDKNKTAPQLMKERGYYRVWNSGNLKFLWSSSSS